ncbi:MAG TPA: OmpA family protein [Bacteroidales bacterium]|jgi:chemotaxis protein MotB|nr:OmpA family protein [Bacteroidales bacterium]HPS71453.1 OmpA family protein [Bacteroidales bacterium]
MKKLNLLLLVCITAFAFSGCVTKSKYVELENRYKTCTKDLENMTSEKIDFDNKSRELEKEVQQLTGAVEQLRTDTMTLTRKLNQSERNLAKLKKDYDDLLHNFTDLNMSNNEEVKKLMMGIDSIKSQLTLREAELKEKEASLAELQEVLKQKDNEVRALKDKVMNALKGYVDKGLKVYEKNGKVYVSMDEKLLFASGSWVVGPEGVLALQELLKVLEQDPDINVLIEGHTDNVPFKGSAQVKDNWDLSVMRATAVVKVLLKDSKIDPLRVSAAGRGEFFPIDPADTPEARAKNRRTEIILTPKLDELFKILESN